MQLITDILEANSLLEQYKVSSMEVTMFDLSLRRMALYLKLTDNENVIYIVGADCKYICGNFRNDAAEMSIEKEQGDDERTIIYDKVSEFRLITTGGFALVYGEENEFGKSLTKLIL